MPFWTSALSEPKRQHRFILRLPNLVSADEEHAYAEYLAKTFTKPSFTVSSTEHKFLGNTYYYPGTVSWNDCAASLVNSLSPDGNIILYDALSKSGYLKPDEQLDALIEGNVGTVNKASALAALGEVEVDELTGKGEIAGTWKLMNAFILDAKFGDLSYEGDDLLNIDITFKYDWATYVSYAVVTEGE
jgi:hypothetical protein